MKFVFRKKFNSAYFLKVFEYHSLTRLYLKKQQIYEVTEFPGGFLVGYQPFPPLTCPNDSLILMRNCVTEFRHPVHSIQDHKYS